PCSGGKVCSAGNCVSSCTDQCAAGDERCSGADSLQTCDVQASGCRDWSLAQLCPGGGSCTANMCITCTNGAKRCSAIGDIEQCVNGAWTQTSSCAFGCSMGACINTGGCTPGAQRCNGSNVETCDATGTTWKQSSMCGAPGCDAATSTCILSSLTISTDTTMEGTVVVAGAVEVMANAKLITNSGLTIRAKTITVDQGGTIQANPSGSGTPGDAATPSSYGGCGGGYSTNGTAGYGGYCTTGVAFGSSTDSAVARGGKGGNGYGPAAGGLGGGVVQLNASDSINIAGRVSADGASGTVNGSYAGGSGA